MMTKRYTAESCHTVGYGWEIDAPESLTEEDLQALIDALVTYTDTPSNSELQSMLLDDCYTEDLDPAKMEEFRKVDIYVESVHREHFTQGLGEI